MGFAVGCQKRGSRIKNKYSSESRGRIFLQSPSIAAVWQQLLRHKKGPTLGRGASASRLETQTRKSQTILPQFHTLALRPTSFLVPPLQCSQSFQGMCLNNAPEHRGDAGSCVAHISNLLHDLTPAGKYCTASECSFRLPSAGSDIRRRFCAPSACQAQLFPAFFLWSIQFFCFS